MSIPKVVLVGGTPFIGKSAVARCLAARYGYCCISTDDIGKAVWAVTNSQSHPGLHSMDDADYHRYFTMTSTKDLISDARRSRETLWPALEKIIRTHADWGDPLVLEGYALWPDLVITADFAATGAVWLTGDDQLLEGRVRSQTDFYRGAPDERALIAGVLKRSRRYNELVVESAAYCCAAVIKVEIYHSVDDVADLCVVALEAEQ